MAAVDHLQRHRHRCGGSAHIVRTDMGSMQRSIQKKRDLGLDSRIAKPFHRNTIGLHDHIVENESEIGFVDSQEGLHRYGGQADLVARVAPATSRLRRFTP